MDAKHRCYTYIKNSYVMQSASKAYQLLRCTAFSVFEAIFALFKKVNLFM